MNRLNSRHVASILPGLMAALLVVICWHFAQPSIASTDLLAARAGSSGQLEYAIQPTGTVPVTVTTFLPFIARNCRCYVFDDFSNPESGWGTTTRPYGTFYYDNGVYRILTDGTIRFVGNSPEWMVPDDAVIRVDAWIDSAPHGLGYYPAIGLVFGLGFYPYQGYMYWLDWYDFRVYPRDQRYALIKWGYGGESEITLATGNSDAILNDLKAVQKLEVRRSGNVMTLMINGTTLTTTTDEYSPYVGPRSVGISIGDSYSAAFDNFEVSASGCITNVGF